MKRLLTAPIRLVILFAQSFWLALGQIATNKLRSLLTTTGIVIGVASVIAVVAALVGMRKKVLDEFESFGTNKIFVFPRRPDTPSKRQQSMMSFRFKSELFDTMLENCPSVGSFTRMKQMNSPVSYQQLSVESVNIQGIEPAWHDLENRDVELGRPFLLIDNQQARPVCLVNKRLIEQLRLPRDPTNESIYIGQRRFTIVGVIEDRADSIFGGNQTGSEILIPFNTIDRLQPFGWMWVIAGAKTTELSEDAAAEITFYLRNKRGIEPGEADDFGVEYVKKFVDQFRAIAVGITVVATGIVGISLLVGGVGIMNIMLVSVSERTREIGLRKAVGAKPSAILLQFLIEAVTLCGIGGAIGLLIGQGLVAGLRSLPGSQLDDAFIPIWAVALSFGFCAAVGLIFGMFPAIKAARLDPIEALRHE